MKRVPLLLPTGGYRNRDFLAVVWTNYDRDTGTWELKKVPYKQLIKD